MARKRPQLPNPEPPSVGEDGVEQLPLTNRIIGPEDSVMKNFVTDSRVMAQVSKLIPMVQKTRSNRQEVEGRWDRYRDIYALRKGQTYYSGRSQLFLGALRKSVDSTVRVAKDHLFSGEYIDAMAENEKLRQMAVEFVKYLLEDQAKAKIVTPLYLRQLYTIGTSCFKLGWLKRKRTVKYREMVDETLRIGSRSIFDHYGPTLDVVDMKRIYIWPENQIDFDHLKLVFEDTETTVGKLKKRAKFFHAETLQKVIERKAKDLAERHRTMSEVVREGIGDPAVDEESLDVTELWAMIELPIGEKGEMVETWALITLAGDDVLRVAENPWWFQHPPYFFGAIFRTHDYFYGHGLIEAGEMWQYMLNDVANQSMDATTSSINAIVLYDPEEIDDASALKIQPNAKWPIKPDAVEFIRPPSQLGMEGLQMVRFLLNVIQEQGGGANALVSGNPREGLGKATGTATGVSTLTQNATSDILDQVIEQESQVFTPLVKAVEIMAHEMMDEAMVIRKLGPDGMALTSRVVSPQNLVLSDDLRWVASKRVKERTVQAQQLLNLINILSGIDPRVLQADGVRVRLGKIIKLIATIGFDLPEVETLIEDVTTTLPDTHPALEHELMKAGRTVLASPMSPPPVTQFHLEAHYQEMQLTQDENYRIKLQEHIMSHFSGAQMAMMGGEGGVDSPLQPGRQATAPGGGMDLLRGLMSQSGGSTGYEGI